MSGRILHLLVSVSAAAFTTPTFSVLAQPQGQVGKYSDVVVRGSIVEPEKIEVGNDKKLAGLIKAPEGFTVEIFARDLINPRMFAVSQDGTLGCIACREHSRAGQGRSSGACRILTCSRRRSCGSGLTLIASSAAKATTTRMSWRRWKKAVGRRFHGGRRGAGAVANTSIPPFY